jgi:hypothetical protein
METSWKQGKRITQVTHHQDESELDSVHSVSDESGISFSEFAHRLDEQSIGEKTEGVVHNAGILKILKRCFSRVRRT